MAHAGQEIEGHAGLRLRFVRTAAETDGEVLELEASYSGEGALPPEHLHPHQTERFEVLEGTMLAIGPRSSSSGSTAIATTARGMRHRAPHSSRSSATSFA